jgi:hypothetical protein
MSSFTSACSSIDFGFSQCFGGWQNASVEVKLSAGQSFPATATGMDVTESVSDLASKTFILTGATGDVGESVRENFTRERVQTDIREQRRGESERVRGRDGEGRL